MLPISRARLPAMPACGLPCRCCSAPSWPYSQRRARAWKTIATQFGALSVGRWIGIKFGIQLDTLRCSETAKARVNFQQEFSRLVAVSARDQCIHLLQLGRQFRINARAA